MELKWYESILIMFAAISTNLMVTVNSYSEIPLLTVIVDVSVRFVWTYMTFLFLEWAYKFVKQFVTR